MSSFNIRPITPNDNAAVAQIIRSVMTDFGAVGEGYSIQDPEVDDMYNAYNNERSIYYVIENESGTVVGCGGIAPLKNGDDDTCELKKMYFLDEARGHGQGTRMVHQLEEDARKRSFRKMYLETIAAMEQANKMYQRLLFQPLPAKMGDTGHSSCGLFYVKNL